MGKVDCFAIPGLDVFFRSSDHLPPHIHVGRPGQWEVRVYFLTCADDFLDFEMKWPRHGGGLNAADRKEILARVLEHRLELLEEWERKVSTR
ncbi:MAG: hypothetical protein AUI36_03540 [Cyanobacteria bacterium 13_1_40CM_2_61_4]|nr:MAG: hypothetical protein AUI36_03540 [Cyanobacteria bacterium 13_1_40CM_2_61_4]